jgi:hypothetical protein
VRLFAAFATSGHVDDVCTEERGVSGAAGCMDTDQCEIHYVVLAMQGLKISDI